MKTPAASIVVIDPVSSGRRYGREIGEKGFHSIALTTRDRFPGLLDRLHSCEGFSQSIKAYSFDEAVEKLSSLNVKAIIPGSDSALKFTDQLAQHFALVGNPVATRQARANKYAMKQRLRLQGVSATQSVEVSLDQMLNLRPGIGKAELVIGRLQRDALILPIDARADHEGLPPR